MTKISKYECCAIAVQANRERAARNIQGMLTVASTCTSQPGEGCAQYSGNAHSGVNLQKGQRKRLADPQLACDKDRTHFLHDRHQKPVLFL